MSPEAKLKELRRKTNPVFNDRKLKLGTFGTNLDRGCAISTIDGVLEINWPNTLELAQLLRGDGVRGAGADRALARLRRRHQFQRSGLRDAFPGPSAIGASTQIFRHLRDLARADHPSDHGGEAGDHHRPRHRRPLRAQHRHRLEQARDRDVRLAADGARRSLRPARRNGCTSSSSCGRARSRSTSRAGSTRSRRAISSRSRSSGRFRR